MEHRAPPDRGSPTATVPVEPGAVLRAIVTAFSGDKRQLPEKWRAFSVARPGDEYFPRTDQLEHEQGDRDLWARYLAKPTGARRDDLFLYDFSDADSERHYWTSEYYFNDRPAPFRCNFLLHVEPSGAGAASVDVLELSPRVWVGRKFSIEAHGPGTYLDIRTVAPTTADRLELVELVRRLAAK